MTKTLSVKVGDLIAFGGKSCLILEISGHKKQWQRRVLLQWVGEPQTYWISYNIVNETVERIDESW